MSRTVTCGVCGWSRTRSRWLPGWTGQQAQIIRAEHVIEMHSYGAPLDSEFDRPVPLPLTHLPDSRLTEARRTLDDGRAFAPHCDQRILHAPGECWSCDLYPDWQKLRELWGIAFTGHRPDIRNGQVECPADYNRPPDSKSDHRQWGPNQAQGERP